MAHLGKHEKDGAWAKYWLTRSIPILESTRTELQQMARRAERVRTADVAAVVQKDPLLLLQALRFIGSRSRTALTADVVSIEAMIMLMGVSPFLDRFSALPTVESLLLPKYPAQYQVFLEQVSFARFSARLALVYANRRYDARPEEITTSATLSRSLELLKLLGDGIVPCPPSLSTGVTAFLRDMGLPELLVSLIEKDDQEQPRVRLQCAVLNLAEQFSHGWWQAEVQQEIERIAGILDAEADDVWKILCQLALAMAHDPGRYPQVDQPARWLPMLPGAWPAPNDGSVPEPESIRPDILSQRMQALHLAGATGRDAKDVMGLAVRALAEGLGMRRIVFSLITQGKPELRARYVLGVPADHPLRNLAISLDGKHLFAKLLEKPQSVWISPESVNLYIPHLPEAVRRTYPAEHFCAMSIFAGEKPLGVILADRQEPSLSEQDYRYFKQICMLTSRALTQSAKR